jgi:protein gp37
MDRRHAQRRQRLLGRLARLHQLLRDALGRRRNLPNHPATGLTRPSKAGHVWTGEVRFNDKALLQPLRWKRPRKIFWNAHGDLFHEKRARRMDRPLLRRDGADPAAHPPGADQAARADAGVCWPAPVHRQRARAVVNRRSPTSGSASVGRGSVKRADERIPLATPAAVRFLSCEPLLGPIDLGQPIEGLPANHWFTWLDKLDWVIVGGESGPGARPMHPDWARLIRDQCAATEVAFFLKQWGEWADMATAGIVADGPVTGGKGNVRDWMRRRPTFGDGSQRIVMAHTWTGHATQLMYRVGKHAAGRHLDGIEHSAMPAPT